MRWDLHVHTTASDGAWTPTEVVLSAAEGGLRGISITDHDTVAGVPEAIEAARGAGLILIPGTELSTTLEDVELHILGYGIDPENEALRARGAAARARRRERMVEMIERLRVASGFAIDFVDVEQRAGGPNGMIGRPHLAAAMVEAGHIPTVNAAFDDWIADEHDAYVPTDLGTPAQAIEAIHGAGGVAIWAHPRSDRLDSMLPGLVEVGLDGVECYRPGYTARHIKKRAAAAKAHGLMVSGGSDWHSPDRNEKLGRFWSTSGQLKLLRERLGVE